MKKFIPAFLIVLFILSIVLPLQSAQAGMAGWQVLNPKADKIDPAVHSALSQLQPGEMTTVIVTLRQQADLSRVKGASRAARLQGVIRALQATASATQKQTRALLDARLAQGSVETYSALWVFNGFSVTATGNVISELAQQPDVYSITPDNIQVVMVAGAPEPNISLVNAPALWSQGFDGQGIVVASMDSGVDASHPDLASRWRGGSDSWFDPYGQHPTTPTDLSGHGTWTTGVMVGGDAGGTSIGVAPGAQWIAVKIFDDQGNSTATAIHLSYQWLLDPDGNPNTADAPQVVNNSWTFANPGCNLEFEPDLQALRAANILPVFAAGNGGLYGDTSYSPANNPSAFAVGAIDNNSQIYTYSSHGPSACDGSTYPELVAPGVDIRTTGRYGTYAIETGTSLAAPHVTGGLALLLSANPDLDAATQEQALIHSAVDLGASGPDDVFGYGRLDLFSALNWIAANPTPTPTVAPYVNLALGQSVTVSSSQDSAHNGSMAVDGNLGTQWQSAKIKGKTKPATEWMVIDLGSLQTVGQVILEWDAYYATGYSVDVSSDNSTWLTRFSTSSGNGGNDTISFGSVQARYVRLDTSAWNNGSYRNWLNEFEVYPSSGSSSPTATPTLAPSATTTPTAIPTSTPTVTPDAGGSIHVGDLDGSTSSSSKSWSASVLVMVHDADENPVEGVTVSGAWSNGANGSGSCVTGADGTCSITRSNIKNNVGSVTFTVSDLAFSLPYSSFMNHDPDGNSNGTLINVLKP